MIEILLLTVMLNTEEIKATPPEAPKIERRRGGKHNKGRRRGGKGLR